MKTLLAWLFGTVTARITGAQPEDFLNLCARENLVLWRMVQRDLFTLEVQVTARQYARLCQLAQGAQCGVELEKRQGLPYFFLRFRRRYALLAGVALCLVLFAIGSRTVLTIDVTGNETVTREEIISQLRLCGVSVGTYGPGIPIREVENRMMMAMDALSYFSLNLHGTRAEVIVREGDPAPEIRAETVPTDVVSSATGVITHIEPWVGDAQFQEGEAVCEGDVLISGRMEMDTVTPTEHDLGTMLVHAEGKVLAQTWHTLTAQISLKAQVKTYTGEEIRHYSLSLMGKRVKFYQNSGISDAECDKIIYEYPFAIRGVFTLPFSLLRERVQPYRTADAPVSEDAARTSLEQALLQQLRETIGADGAIISYETAAETTGNVLTVTLTAECEQEIGRAQATPDAEFLQLRPPAGEGTTADD